MQIRLSAHKILAYLLYLNVFNHLLAPCMVHNLNHFGKKHNARGSLNAEHSLESSNLSMLWLDNQKKRMVLKFALKRRKCFAKYSGDHYIACKKKVYITETRFIKANMSFVLTCLIIKISIVM